MPIDVIEESWRLARCPETRGVADLVGVYQCDDHNEHMGSHHHAISDTEILLWPSQDDIDGARMTAELDAKSDEQIMDELVAGGQTREDIAAWAGSLRKSALNMGAAYRALGELRLLCRQAVDQLREHNREYHHFTPPAFIAELERLAKG